MPETTQSDLVERLTEMADLYRRAISDDNGDAQTFAYAAAEIARLRKRLELREPDWPEAADGIACRDDTIALLDDRVARQSAEITRLRADSERLQKIESQMDGGRFDEWQTETFVGQLRMQARDSLDPEYSQFVAATANHMESLRAHCEAMEKALGLYTCHPCPVCNGDCGSANPPVLNCPTQAALDAFGGWDAYRKESGA